MSLSRRCLFSVFALAMSGMVCGAAQAATITGNGLPPVSYVSGRIPASVPTLSPQSAIAQIRNSGGLDAIVSVALGPAPSGATSTGPSLVTTVKGGSSVEDGADYLGRWEADLLVGAVSDLSGSGPSIGANLSSATVAEQLTDGSVVSDVPNTGGFGNVASHQAFSDDSLAQIQSSVATVAAKYGLLVESVRVVHALTAAPVVVVRASDTSALAKAGEVATAMFGNPPRYEGYYLEWDDTNGTPLLRQTASFRTGAGRVWANPSFTGSIGVIHGGPGPNSLPLAADCSALHARIASLRQQLISLVAMRRELAKEKRNPLTAKINKFARQRARLIRLIPLSACAVRR